MAIEQLRSNRKYHIAGGNEMRLPPANGVMDTTTALCGRIVSNEYLESTKNVGDDDDQEALFCHRCLDQRRTRDPFG